jgi:hypothetical protein
MVSHWNDLGLSVYPLPYSKLRHAQEVHDGKRDFEIAGWRILIAIAPDLTASNLLHLMSVSKPYGQNRLTQPSLE